MCIFICHQLHFQCVKIFINFIKNHVFNKCINYLEYAFAISQEIETVVLQSPPIEIIVLRQSSKE